MQHLLPNLPIPRSTFFSRAKVVPLVLLLGVLTACGENRGSGPAMMAVTDVRPADGVLDREALRDIVELGIARDAEALRELLSDDDPAVRARAAFALASVRDSSAVPELTALLDDPEPGVRRDAAFALAQVELPDGGAALVGALGGEEDPAVRGRLIDATGRRGDIEALDILVASPPREGEDARWVLALARAAARGATPDGAVEVAAERLEHPDPAVREMAAYFFARHPDPAGWAGAAERVRSALDGYPLDEPAAMHLVTALARQRDRNDAPRLLRRLEEGEDWRVRANAAAALGTTLWLETSGVRDGLLRALHDPSGHVGASAARALDGGLRVGARVLEAAVEIVRDPQGPRSAQVALLPMLAQLYELDAITEWTQRMLEEDPDVAVSGVRILGGMEGPGAVDLLLEATEHANPRVRGVGFRMVGQIWPNLVNEERDPSWWLEFFAAEAIEGPEPSAAAAAAVLASPPLAGAGSMDILKQAYEDRVAPRDRHLAGPFLTAMARSGEGAALDLVVRELCSDHRELREAAAGALESHAPERLPGGADEESPIPPPEVEWGFLQSLGAEPRMRLETERGEISIRLVPLQAPLSVQSLAGRVADGLHDDVPFHRVEPAFLVQGGDIVAGDGTGHPGDRLRTELTGIPFGRGVVGLASDGPDTEGSQYFIVHSRAPELDGEFTPLGWVESGLDVVDGLRVGDRVVRATIEPGD